MIGPIGLSIIVVFVLAIFALTWVAFVRNGESLLRGFLWTLGTYLVLVGAIAALAGVGHVFARGL